MTENAFVQIFHDILNRGLLFGDFSQAVRQILSDAWRGDKSLLSEKLSKVLTLVHEHLDETRIPIDMLVEALGAYKIVSVTDLDENKEEIVALSNWVMKQDKIPLEIKPSTIVGAGFGLFATDNIGQNVAVTNYGGVVSQSKSLPRGGAYVLEMEKETFLDGETGFRIREMGRWANGFPSASIWNVDQHNNCVFTKNPFEKNRLCVASSVPISNGSELFAEYGEHYEWELLGYTKAT